MGCCWQEDNRMSNPCTWVSGKWETYRPDFFQPFTCASVKSCKPWEWIANNLPIASLVACPSCNQACRQEWREYPGKLAANHSCNLCDLTWCINHQQQYYFQYHTEANVRIQPPVLKASDVCLFPCPLPFKKKTSKKTNYPSSQKWEKKQCCKKI